MKNKRQRYKKNNQRQIISLQSIIFAISQMYFDLFLFCFKPKNCIQSGYSFTLRRKCIKPRENLVVKLQG